MRCLVTGGAGFIGSHVVDELLDLGHVVHVIDDLSGGYRENVNPKAILHVGSITDNEFLDKIFENIQFDYIFHLAAYAAEGLSHFIRKFNYENNLIGSINLINWAVKQKVKKFIFTSSIAVYGSGNVGEVFEEIDPPKPEDPYAIAKQAVELDLKAAHEIWGLDYVIFRPHNVYGPRQNIADKYRNVVGIFLNQVLQNITLTIFGDGNQTRSFTYIKDITPIIADAIINDQMTNQIINLGSDQVYMVMDLAHLVLTKMGWEFSPLWLNYQPARVESVHSHCDHSKLQTWYPGYDKTTLSEGLNETIEWVLKYGSRQSQEFKNIEITENLPPLWKS